MNHSVAAFTNYQAAVRPQLPAVYDPEEILARFRPDFKRESIEKSDNDHNENSDPDGRRYPGDGIN